MFCYLLKDYLFFMKSYSIIFLKVKKCKMQNSFMYTIIWKTFASCTLNLWIKKDRKKGTMFADIIPWYKATSFDTYKNSKNIVSNLTCFVNIPKLVFSFIFCIFWTLHVLIKSQWKSGFVSSIYPQEERNGKYKE